MKNDIRELLKEKHLIYDGAMGSVIIEKKLCEDDYHGHLNCHDYLSISRPEIIKSIHAAYIEAGCDVIETNSFSANPLTLFEHGLENKAYEIALNAAKIAKEVAENFSTSNRQIFVAGSVGPGSKLPTLLQTGFDELYDSYIIQILALIKGGADLIQIETCQDLLQIKCAVAAAFDAMKKCGKKIPVNVTFTVEKNGKMLLGTEIKSVVTALAPFDLFALGLNCGTGPESMFESIKTMKEISPFPLIILPNAGLPELVDGELKYSMPPQIFGDHLHGFVRDHGVNIVGGCCGTTPSHIKAVVQRIEGIVPALETYPEVVPAVCSTFAVQSLNVEPKPLIIGERANANGSKVFREALLKDDIEAMMEIVDSQQSEGSHLLDLTVAYAGRNELTDMVEMVKRINRDISVPLCIDSTDPHTIEAALKCYGGKALINSINLEDGGKKAEKILAVAAKYGASVIGLTIDEEGMAQTAGKKFEIAERLRSFVVKNGLKPSDLLVDTLTFTLGSGDRNYYNAAVESFNAIKRIKAEIPDIFTVLGVSNCSYGLKPKARKILNAVYLYHAVESGLDAAIFHAGKVVPIDSIKEDVRNVCKDLIFNNRDENYDPLAVFLEAFESGATENATENIDEMTTSKKLFNMVLNGRNKDLDKIIEELLKEKSAVAIINDDLLRAMEVVGVNFKKGTTQLPFVLKSAETVKRSCDILEPHLKSGSVDKKGTIVLATVKGDIHDIGKNLVDIILSNNGYTVKNIGIDKSVSEITEAVLKYNPDAVGLSALLVSSALEMKAVAGHFAKNGIKVPIICGGAALNRDYIDKEVSPLNSESGAFYASDAFEAIEILGKLKDARG
jgi:5-methyltetrahydrofolate--homocysteine methyltransferase